MQTNFCLTALTAVQVQLFTDIIEDCRQAEPLRLRFPEDGDLFLFTCEEGKALSCIIVCKVQEDLWECYGFTRPDCRRKGLFSSLLEKLCQITPAQTELVFLLDHQSPDALAAVQALDMELWHTEYQMERIIHTAGAPGTSLLQPPSSFSINRKPISEDGLQGWIFSAFSSANPVGNCRIFAYSDSRFYLCHVEILKPFRNQGLGTQLINAVIRELPVNSSLSLQVSSENKAALNLYKKTGFRITETLSYYLY